MADARRPDPATDLVGALRYVMDAIDELRERDGARRVTGTEAARELGYGRGHFQKPWRIPGFGLRGRTHPIRAWRAWNEERTDAERRALWDAMPIEQRRRARGAAA